MSADLRSLVIAHLSQIDKQESALDIVRFLSSRGIQSTKSQVNSVLHGLLSSGKVVKTDGRPPTWRIPMGVQQPIQQSYHTPQHIPQPYHTSIYPGVPFQPALYPVITPELQKTFDHFGVPFEYHNVSPHNVSPHMMTSPTLQTNIQPIQTNIQPPIQPQPNVILSAEVILDALGDREMIAKDIAKELGSNKRTLNSMLSAMEKQSMVVKNQAVPPLWKQASEKDKLVYTVSLKLKNLSLENLQNIDSYINSL